jgi:hypothetical protein
METFHTIVLSIAVVILILILTIVGIMLNNKKHDKSVFPPIKNSCPDYWTVGNAETQSCTINTKNAGKNNIWKTADDMHGYNANGTVDFSDAGWTSKGGTALCNMKKWANNNNISWDGVSNFNGCK